VVLLLGSYSWSCSARGRRGRLGLRTRIRQWVLRYGCPRLRCRLRCRRFSFVWLASAAQSLTIDERPLECLDVFNEDLPTDDIAIYIVGEDNHNVATHVVCVFSDQDALVAPRAEQLQL